MIDNYDECWSFTAHWTDTVLFVIESPGYIGCYTQLGGNFFRNQYCHWWKFFLWIYCHKQNLQVLNSCFFSLYFICFEFIYWYVWLDSWLNYEEIAFMNWVISYCRLKARIFTSWFVVKKLKSFSQMRFPGLHLMIKMSMQRNEKEIWNSITVYSVLWGTEVLSFIKIDHWI